MIVKTGLDVLVDTDFAVLDGKRVGLITNQTGIARDFRDNIALFHDAPNVELTALFAPEHGVLGVEQAGAHVQDARERRTNVPVHSLYGELRHPTAEQLADVDVLVYDIQAVGSR
ncbi:MAG: DUF1343 domain-containing protein, partial [Candidatus Poribacteria bacterium]|nr:DUF1343 domain-containing protein [Candidatus Poribacteria bacterium]